MSFSHRFGRLAWWRREDDPAARARQALAAMRAEKSGRGSALLFDSSHVADNATNYDSGSGAGGGGSD